MSDDEQELERTEAMITAYQAAWLDLVRIGVVLIESETRDLSGIRRRSTTFPRRRRRSRRWLRQPPPPMRTSRCGERRGATDGDRDRPGGRALRRA